MGVPVRLPGRTVVATSDVHPSGERSRAVPLLATTVITVLTGATLLASGAPGPASLTIAALVPAAVVDVTQRRLPDRLVASSAAVLVVSLLASWAVVGTSAPPAVADIAAGSAAFAGPLLVVHLCSPSAIGFGDVKAAVVLGAALGTVDWRLGLVALAVGTAAAAVVGLVGRAASVPLGPFLLVGAATALVGADRLAGVVTGNIG